MAKAIVKVSGMPIDAMVAEIESIGIVDKNDVLKALDKQMEVHKTQLKTNWNSMVSWSGTDTGKFIYDSIHKKSSLAKRGDPEMVYASYGFYHVDHIAMQHGRDPKKDLTAPQLSWWVEYGTAYMPANTVLLNSFIVSEESASKAFVDEMNRLIDLKLKA